MSVKLYREEGGGVGDVVAHLSSSHDSHFILLYRWLFGLSLLYSDVTIHVPQLSPEHVKAGNSVLSACGAVRLLDTCRVNPKMIILEVVTTTERG